MFVLQDIFKKTTMIIFTCRCARCTNYLGDAHLQGESCERNCAVHTTTVNNADPSVSGDVDNSTGVEQAFTVSDLRDVRFALNSVTFSVSTAGALFIRTQAEQVNLNTAMLYRFLCSIRF